MVSYEAFLLSAWVHVRSGGANLSLVAGGTARVLSDHGDTNGVLYAPTVRLVIVEKSGGADLRLTAGGWWLSRVDVAARERSEEEALLLGVV